MRRGNSVMRSALPCVDRSLLGRLGDRLLRGIASADGRARRRLGRARLSLHRALGTVYRGWALAGSGQTAEGIALLRAGVAAYSTTGAATELPFFLTLLAEAEGKAKQRDEGLGHLAEAERLMAETEERWAEAELYRVRGELLRAGDDPTAAERCFSQAIGIAQQQSAKFWELRAAISLARLWRDQGKRDAARDLLAPTYGWFAEGFDTPVLKEAKALLDALAP